MLTQTNTAPSSGDLSTKSEVMRTALILIKCKGRDALEYSKRKADVMKDRGVEEDVVFWQRISKQIEIILYSNE